jgi:DNA polymerase III delta subunit
VHFLCGDETVGRERFKLKLINSIRELHGNITTESFDMETDDFSAFMESALTPSLFQDTRVLQVHRAQRLGDDDLKNLNHLLDAPPPDIYIIIEIDEEKKGKAEYKAYKKFKIEKRCSSKESDYVFLEFPRPSEYRIGAWLVEQLPRLFNRSISKTDADFLVDLVGNDLNVLYSELQKIDTHLPAGKPVERQIIEKIVGASRQMTAFELAAALAQHQFPRALQIIDSLFSTSAFVPAIVSAIYRHFWAMFRIQCFGSVNPQIIKWFENARGYNNSDQNECGYAIGRAAGLLGNGEQRKVYPVIIASGIVSQARNFTDQEYKLIFKWLLEFDYGIKTGGIEGSQQDLQMLCFKINRVTELLRDGIAG